MTSETSGRTILATELLKDGYHERAERVAAGNECMSDEPAVRACVEAVGENAWQPIETAPRNGDDILVVHVNPSMMQVVSWDQDAIDEWAWLSDGDIRYHAEAFTHWQPLPAPPAINPIIREIENGRS